MRARAFQLGLAVALVVGLALRLAIIASPLGEIDGDEAVVGLMARHIAFTNERPVFYWGQPYLGSLEAFTAAPLFKLFDSSTPLLKLVPTLYSLGFLALSAVLARRLFGTPAGLATAAYLALPPAMWAVWSTKARGGYAEVLFLGQALLLITLLFGIGRGNLKLAMLWGLLAGLAFWTHLLAIVYILPAVIYLILARRRAWRPRELALVVAGTLIGMLPLIIDNVSTSFRTLQSLLQPPDLPIDPLAQFIRFFRVGVPVLLGLGQPTTSQTMFDLDWLQRPASQAWLAALVLAVVVAAVIVFIPALRRLVRCGPVRQAEPALLVLLVLAIPPVVALTRFGFFVSEPRYALPLYGAVPLLAGALWRVPIPNLARGSVVASIVVFNLWSLVSTDQRLWRPEETVDSTAATRAELVEYLVAQDRHQLYTDYWIGYPIMFETRENVLAFVISGGFNRYIPPADNVQRTPNPAWVFTPDQPAETEFLDQLAEARGTATTSDVSAYRVYTDVQPLAALRPRL